MIAFISKTMSRCLVIQSTFCFAVLSAMAQKPSLVEEPDSLSRKSSDYAEAYSVKYSAVNPALFLYNSDDVHINSPSKFENGKNVINPNPVTFPWEGRLENGMPNVIVSEYGDLSIYLSSFIAFANRPPSKVGAVVYTNNTDSYTNWNRPNAGLYWFDVNGTVADDKVVSTPGGNTLSTNIVATDIESLGIYDQYDVSKDGIKLIYLPQRESHNKIISAYLMDKTFNTDGVLSGFSKMKADRQKNQVDFTFDFINGDTHMGILKVADNYSFVSRVNAKRSYVKPTEHLPFRPDARKRYRRETISPIGYNFVSQHVSLNVALDMSTPQWEPYSMQPFQMPGFEHDIWYGLVTMFGTEGDPDVAAKQRTELAISNDGFHWRYLKPGVPFLDNGTDPNSDDYGCINAAIPVNNTKFSSDRDDLYYFYAASNKRHVAGRNPGVSLAFGRRGAWAGLQASQSEKQFNSPCGSNFVQHRASPSYSLYNAFYMGNQCTPQLLADVTQDPTGKNISNLNSYAAVLIYALDPSTNNKGSLLTAVLGNCQSGSSSPSNTYESVPFIYQGKDASSKYYLMQYFRELSQSKPDEIISMKTMDAIPVLVESKIKNGTLYGLKFEMTKPDAACPLSLEHTTLFQPKNIWTHAQTNAADFFTQDFSGVKLAPNETTPVNMTTGTIAITATPASQSSDQVLINMYGDSNNDNSLDITYNSQGQFVYTLTKDNLPFAQMVIEPPTGQSFVGKQVNITLESVLPRYRKYGKNITEQVTLFRVSCPALGFEKIVPQQVLWDWKHADGQITDSDRANAQCFAFLEFSSFAPSLNKITVGSKNSSGVAKFMGTIHKVEVAPTLPEGSSDFWN